MPRGIVRSLLLQLVVISVLLCGAVTAEPVLKTYYVEESYAIVIGRLKDVTVAGTAADHRGRGVIEVESVVVGPLKPRARVAFDWTHNPRTAAICPPSFDYRFASNRLSIWFVERAEDGVVRASGEVWNLEDGASIQFHIDYLVGLRADSPRAQAVLKVLRDRLTRL